MRIATLQINSLLGAASANRKKLFEMYVAAAKDGADIAIAPEAALTGYPLEDLVLRESFLEGVSKEREGLIQDILDSGYFTAFVFGSPRHNNSIIHNSAYFVDPWNKTVQVRDKQELPNYGVFDEKRVYRTGGKNSPIEWRKYKIGLMICEDWWHSRVAEQLKDSDFIIIINGSPYEDNKINTRREISVERFNEIKKPFVYVNLVGGQDELVFDGQSFLYDGESLQEAASFKEGIYIFEIDLDKEKVLPSRIYINKTTYDLADTYRALVLGTRDYLYKLGFSDSLLGYSGGVDSGLVGAISCDAIRPEHTHLVRLPSNFSSPESLTDAAEGAKRLGADMLTMHIESIANAIRGTFALGPNVYDPERPKQELTGVADENIQARARGLLLMALSNQFGWMLLTTGNKSEMSVGYATIYGDMSGGFNPIKDVYKTKVWDLCRWRNDLSTVKIEEYGFFGKRAIVVPESIISKTPSAELRLGQKDQDSLPPYFILDLILECLIEKEMSVAETVEKVRRNAGEEFINWPSSIRKKVDIAEYKRRQGAPGVKISPRIYGRDRRYPIVNRWSE